MGRLPEIRPESQGAARHVHLGNDGRIHPGVACNADRFCRCRRCKPPLGEARSLQRLRIGLLLASGALFAAMIGGAL